MIIDCDGCTMKDLACHDCVVTVLLASPPVRVEQVVEPAAAEVDLDHAEQAAIAALAGHGMVPPLRLVTGQSPDEVIHRTA